MQILQTRNAIISGKSKKKNLEMQVIEMDPGIFL